MPNLLADERARNIERLPLEPVGQKSPFFSGTFRSFQEIVAQKNLIRLLINRELKARYKGSSLGILWSLARPILTLVIYYFVIGQVLGVARSIPSFAIFVFVGLTIWNFFSEMLSDATSAIVRNDGLVKKIYLPREVFPLASVGSSAFNFLVQLVVLIAATLVFGQPPMVENLPYAILSIALILVFGSGLGILLSALNVYFRDIEHLISVLLIVLFWASPIVYSYSLVTNVTGTGLLQNLYLSNPVTLSVLGFQKAFWTAGSHLPDVTPWPENLGLLMVVALGVSIIFLWFSQRIFSRLEGNFAQEL